MDITVLPLPFGGVSAFLDSGENPIKVASAFTHQKCYQTGLGIVPRENSFSTPTLSTS